MKLSNFYKVAFFQIIVMFISISTLQGKTYHISKTDVGANYQTLSQVNALSLKPGDSVLFHAGETWRETLEISWSGTKGNLIYFGKYGSGSDPKILGSEKAINWTTTGTSNIWKTATSLIDYDDYEEGAIYFLFSDTIVDGISKDYNSGFSNLTEEYQFCNNGGQYYVYCPADPDSRYDSIEISQRDKCIVIVDSQSYLMFEDLEIRYPGQYCFDSGYPADPSDNTYVFSRCTIGYVGYRGSSRAYGIELGGASNSLIENCYFSNCGRRAISANLYDLGSPGYRTLENVIIRDNVFRRGWHTTSLDLAGNETAISDTIRDIYFYNNYIIDSNNDHVVDVSPYTGSNGIFIYTDGNTYMNNIYVVNNVFHASTQRAIHTEGGDTIHIWNNTLAGHNSNVDKPAYAMVAIQDSKTVHDIRNNIMYQDYPSDRNDLHNYTVGTWNITPTFAHKDYNLYYTSNFASGADRGIVVIGTDWYEQGEWSKYKSSYPSHDPHSPTPADPLFTDFDNDDFTLSETSPAQGAGVFIGWVTATDPFGVTDTINKYDMQGFQYDTENWDIGAYAYNVAVPSSATDIIQFTLDQQIGSTTIDKENHTINIVVKQGTIVSNLIPTIKLSPGATINPISGSPQDFSVPVEFTVTAQDGVSTQVWKVVVSISDNVVPENQKLLGKVYPNPSNGIFNIELDAASIIQIYNSTGTKIYEKYHENQLMQMNLDLASGFYSIMVTNDQKESQLKKFVIIQ